VVITDDDEDEIVRLVIADIDATLGPGYESLARANAARLREFIEDLEHYFADVIEATQQDLHDHFIDTDWPKCPVHGRHPLWLHEGGWWCEQERVLIARVGELGSRCPPHDGAPL
jgi:hypothetical protein